MTGQGYVSVHLQTHNTSSHCPTKIEIPLAVAVVRALQQSTGDQHTPQGRRRKEHDHVRVHAGAGAQRLHHGAGRQPQHGRDQYGLLQPCKYLVLLYAHRYVRIDNHPPSFRWY